MMRCVKISGFPENVDFPEPSQHFLMEIFIKFQLKMRFFGKKTEKNKIFKIIFLHDKKKFFHSFFFTIWNSVMLSIQHTSSARGAGGGVQRSLELRNMILCKYLQVLLDFVQPKKNIAIQCSSYNIFTLKSSNMMKISNQRFFTNNQF